MTGEGKRQLSRDAQRGGLRLEIQTVEAFASMMVVVLVVGATYRLGDAFVAAAFAFVLVALPRAR